MTTPWMMGRWARDQAAGCCRSCFAFSAAAWASTRAPGQTVRLLLQIQKARKAQLPLADDIDPKGKSNSTLRELGLLVTVLLNGASIGRFLDAASLRCARVALCVGLYDQGGGGDMRACSRVENWVQSD